MEHAGKARRFAALHDRAFVVANAWDAGSARMLSGMGFAALATTSGGLAFHRGHADAANLTGRDVTLRNAAEIAAATELPVSADLENGFGDRPEDVAETIRLAVRTGVVGGSVEDATGRAEAPIYPRGLAVERVQAAAEAARTLGFTLTARAENHLYGIDDLDDTIARLRAFEDAGADVLYAPALPSAPAIAAVCAAVDRPVNVLATGAAARLSLEELARLGARRISLGSALPKVAMTAAYRAAREVAEAGIFTAFADAMSFDQLLNG